TTANAMLNFMIELKTKAPQFDNPFDALEYIRSEEGAGLRGELLGPLQAGISEAGGRVGLTGEKKFLPFMIDLLQRDPTAAQDALSRSVQGIPSLAAAGPMLETDLAAINASERQQTADLQRRLAAATQQRQLVNVTGGRASIAREG